MANDYDHLRFHISFVEAIGRRLRRNYIWIFIVLALAYFVKLAIHPVDVESIHDFFTRAAIGPLPGPLVLCLFSLWYCFLFGFALFTIGKQDAHGRVSQHEEGVGDRIRSIRV